MGDPLQLLVALALRNQPEEVFHLDAAGVGRCTDLLEAPAHTHAERVVVLKGQVCLPQVQRAHVADRHERVAPGRFRVGEDARVQVQVVVGLGLVDVACPAARDRLQLVEPIPSLGASACVEMSSSLAESEARQPL